MGRKKLYTGYFSKSDYQRSREADLYNSYIEDQSRKRSEEDQREKQRKELEKKKAEQRNRSEEESTRQQQNTQSSVSSSPFNKSYYDEERNKKQANDFMAFLKRQQKEMFDTVERRTKYGLSDLYNGIPDNDTRVQKWIDSTTKSKNDEEMFEQYPSPMEKPEGYGPLQYIKDASTTFLSAMNEAQANNFAGKKVRMQNISDIKNAVDIALENDDKRSLIDKYFDLTDQYFAISNKGGKDNIKRNLQAQIQYVTRQLNQYYPEQAANGGVNDIFLMNEKKLLGFGSPQYNKDVNAIADLNNMIDYAGVGSGVVSKALRSLGLWLHSGNSKEQVDKDKNSIRGIMDNLFGDDVYEGLEYLRGYTRASKEERKKMSNAFNNYTKNRNEYWDAARNANLEDKRKVEASHKVSSYFKNKMETSSDDVVEWDGIIPSLNMDNILYKQVQQQGYSNSSWDKNVASYAMQLAALLATKSPTLAATFSATGAAGQYQAGVEENNGQILEDYQQRLVRQLKDDDLYDDVIKAGKKKFKNSSEQEIIEKIATGQWDPNKSQVDPIIVKSLSESLAQSRRGVNAVFDKDMMAVGTDALVNFGLYSSKIPSGFGSAIAKTTGKAAAYTVRKIDNTVLKNTALNSVLYTDAAKAGVKDLLTRAGKSKVGKYVVATAKDIKSGFGAGYKFGEKVSPLSGVIGGAVTGTAKAITKQLPESSIAGKIVNNLVKDVQLGTELLKSVPKKILTNATNLINDPSKAFLAQQVAKGVGEKTINIGGRMLTSGFSESIEEGKQYLNGQDWVNNDNPQNVIGFFDTLLTDMSVGNSLITSALGIPFGAKWGLAAKDPELYANMTGGYLGGAMHNASIEALSTVSDLGFKTLTGSAPLSLENVIIHNTLLDQNSRLNQFGSLSKMAKQMSSVSGKQQFDDKLKEFRDFNKQREEQGLDAFTQDQIDEEQKIADNLYKIYNSPKTKFQAANALIQPGSKKYAKFVAAKHMYQDMLDELSDEAIQNSNDTNKILNQLIQLEEKSLQTIDARNQALGNTEAEKATSFLSTVFKDGVEGDSKRAYSDIATLIAIQRLLKSIGVADEYSSNPNGAYVQMVKHQLQSTFDNISKLYKEDVLGDILNEDAASYVEDQDLFNQLIDAYQKQFGQQLDVNITNQLLHILANNNFGKIDSKTKKFLKQLGITGTASSVLDALDKNIKSHYGFLDAMNAEISTREEREKEEAEKQSVSEEAFNDEFDEFYTEEEEQANKELNDPEQLVDNDQIPPVVTDDTEQQIQEKQPIDSQEQQPIQSEPQPIQPVEPIGDIKPDNIPTQEQEPVSEEKPNSKYGESNKVFTEDVLKQALKDLHNYMNRAHSGVDPVLLEIGIKILGYHVEAGSRKFIQAVTDTYTTLKQNNFTKDQIRELSKQFKSWYMALSVEDSMYQFADEFDDPTTVRNTDVQALIDGFEHSDSVQDEKERLWKKYKEEVAQSKDLYKIYESLDELYVDKNLKDGKVGVINRSDSSVIIFNTTQSGSIIDQQGAVYMSNYNIIPESQRTTTKTRTQQEKSLVQQRELERLNQQIEKDNESVLGVSGHDYFIRESDGRIVLYSRVHTVLGDQYERKQEEIDLEKEYYTRVRQLIEDRDYDALEELIKDKIDSYKLYIDVLKQDNKQYEEVATAITSLLSRTEPGVSVDLGNIVDELIRIYFDEDLSNVTPLVYSTLTVPFGNTRVSISNFMSEKQFNDFLQDLKKLEEQYEGYKFSTKKHTWHSKVTLPDGTVKRIAGETDIIAIDEDGNYTIIDIKTSNKTFAKRIIKTQNGEEVYNPFDDAHPLYDGRKAKHSTKTQYAKQLSMYMLLLRYAMPNIQFSQYPIQILPVRLQYEYRSVDLYKNQVEQDGNAKTLAPLLHDIQNGRNEEPQIIELDVQKEIIDGYFPNQQAENKIQVVLDRLSELEDRVNQIFKKDDKTVWDIILKLKLHTKANGIRLFIKNKKNIKQDASNKQINDILKRIDDYVSDLDNYEDRIYNEFDNQELNKKEEQQPTLDERTNDFVVIDNLCKQIYEESKNWAKNQSSDNYIALQNLVEELNDLVDKFTSKYDDPNELSQAIQIKQWFSEQVKPMSKSQTQAPKPLYNTTTNGYGWKDYNTADRKSVNDSYAIDDPNIRLQDVTGNPDFDEAEFEIVGVTERKGQKVFIVKITYQGHTFKNIDVQIANNSKGAAILQQYEQANRNRKQGQKILLTGLSRTAGVVKSGKYRNILDSIIMYGKSLYDISIEASQFIFGICKFDKTNNVNKVVCQGVTKSGESKIFTFKKGQGNPGMLYSVIRPAFKNADPDAKVVPYAHNVQTETISSDDADLIIQLLESPGTPNYEVTLDNGDTVNIPFSHANLINIFIPYGTYDNKFRTAEHVRADGRTIIFTYNPTSKTDPGIRQFNLDSDADREALKKYLMSKRINIDAKPIGSRLGNATDSDPRHPFKGLATWFKRHPNIKTIRIGKSRLMFSREDFSNPAVKGDTLGLSGLAWMMKNGMIVTDFEGIGNPRFSFSDIELQNEKPEKEAGDEEGIVDENEGLNIYEGDDDGESISLDLFGDDLDPDSMYHRQNKKASKTINKEKAIKRLRKMFGNKVSVQVVENIASFVRNATANVVGAVVGDTIFLSESAEYGTEYHEAFHRVSRLLLPVSLRKILYKGIKKTMIKKYGKQFAEQATEKQYEEFGANLCHRYFNNIDTVKFNIKEPLEFIRQHYEAFKKVGSFRMYLLFIAMQNGVFKFFDSSEQAKLISEENLKYQIRGVGFEHIFNDKMYDTMKRSILYYLIYLQGIRPDGKNIQKLDLTKETIDKTFVKAKVRKDGKKVVLKRSLREILIESCKTEAGKLAANELLDNWDIVKPDIISYIEEIGIDYEETEELRREEEMREGEGNGIEEHTKAAYETSRLVKASSGIRFFMSMIKQKIQDENGKWIDKRNELGFYEFMDKRDVLNLIFSQCHDVKSPSEMLSRFKELSKTNPMYTQIYALVKGTSDRIVREDGSINANNEQFVTQLFGLVSCCQMHFKMLRATKNRHSKKYGLVIEDCGQQYEALQYRKNWGKLLTYGGTKLFTRDDNGNIAFKQKDADKILGSIFDKFQEIKDAFSPLSIYNLQNGEAPTLRLKGELINVTVDEDLRKLKQTVCEMFNYIGIEISVPELNYMLNEKYKDENTEFERIQAFFQEGGADSIEQLWLKHNVIRKTENGWVWNVDTSGNILGTKILAENMYNDNWFVSELSKYKYQYQHLTKELSVLVSGGDKYYTMSENNLITDVTDEINSGKPFLDMLQKFCYNIITDSGVDEDGNTVEIPIGSIIIKAAKLAKEQGKKLNMKVCTFVQFKTNEYNDDGSGYFDISEREDYAAKATILEQGGLIFPTMSDKKTWVYLEGIELKGITYTKDRTGKYVDVDVDDTAAIDQLIEYAETELMSIEQTIEQLKTLPEEEKVNNFHTGTKVVEIQVDENGEKREIVHKVANGTIFSSLTGVVVDGKYISFNRFLDQETGKFISPEENVRIADEYFFSKGPEERRRLIRELIAVQVNHELEHLQELGLVSYNISTGQYENIGLNEDAIELIAKKQFGNNFAYAKSEALKIYVRDLVEKSIMSIQEVERVYSGHPGFFKYKIDKKGRIVNRSVDEFKRLGGLISTGQNNNTEIIGAPKDGMYTAAEIENDKVASDQLSLIYDIMSSAEWKQALRQLKLNGVYDKEKRNNICDEIDNLTSEEAEKQVLELNPNVHKLIKAKIEKEVSAYKEGIDVADGAAYISPEMTEWLLRMCGKWDNKVQKAFEILKDPKADIAKQAEAYKTVTTRVIGAQKYTAYGMRLSNDKKTLIPYYNKLAFFPIFKCIATGEFAKVYDKMQNNKNPDGSPNPVHVLFINSAVKVGNQGVKKYSSDDSFTFNTRKEPFNRLRKQFNTDPVHKEEQAAGTQMLKVALSSLITNHMYTTETGKKIRGSDLLKQIMDDINSLSDEGVKQIYERLFDSTGKIDQEKFSKFLHEQLTSRDADKSILDSISLQTDGTGRSFLKHPLSAISRTSWLQSIITSFINKTVVDVNTNGNTFYQRSVWKIEGRSSEFMTDENLPEDINGGKPLQMIIEDGPAKGAMDCVLTIDYFADALKEAGLQNATFEEQRQALIDAGIIGQNAKANLICYRIPTQAQSSIHALRCVDVLPVIQHSIIMPKEFTRITGSDFDIDKLFIASININLQKQNGKWINFDKSILNDRDAIQDRLVQNYITILRDETSAHMNNRSIDNDTDLVLDVLKEIEEGASVEKEVTPYEFYLLRTHTRTKNDFLTGKRGIGPYALNNNSHVLTMLYGVAFNNKSVMYELGHERLDRVTDDDNQPILSWISALINAHVDIAKDPYISRLNINQMTYNVSNLLIRTGYGKRAFYFAAQPVMKKMAEKYIQANCKFLQEEGKSQYQISKEAKRKAAVELCTEQTVAKWENIFFTENNKNKYDTVAYTIAREILSNKDNILLNAAKNKINGTVEVAGYTMNSNDIQAVIYLIDQMLEKPAQSISDLVKYTKIDTKKQGKNINEQLEYIKGVAEMFGDTKIMKKIFGIDVTDVETYDGPFEHDSLWKMYSESFIMKKTHNAIFTFFDTIKENLIEATPAFRSILNTAMYEFGIKGISNINLFSDVLSGYFKSIAITKFAERNNIDIVSLVSGNNTIYDRLCVLKCKIMADEEYADMRNEDGSINNPLLNLLISDKTWQYDKSHHKGRGADKLANLKFVRLFDSLDVSSSKRDYIIQAWDDLLNDGKHPDIQKFALDLCVYAFFTSADRGGSKTIFSFVPNSFRENSGYVSAIRELLWDMRDPDYYKDKCEEIIQNVMLNLASEGSIIPTVKLNQDVSQEGTTIWNTITSNEERTDINGDKYIPSYPDVIYGDSQTPIDLDDIKQFIKVRTNNTTSDGSQRDYAVYKLDRVVQISKTQGIPYYVKINSKGYDIDGYRFYELGFDIKDEDYDIEYNPYSSDEDDYLESNGIITQEHIKKPEDATYDVPENNAGSTTNNDSSNTLHGRQASIEEELATIQSDKTILSNEELAIWNKNGVGERPRILVASEHSDPAFHVKEILDILDGKTTVNEWGVVNGKRQVVNKVSGKDFAGLYLITKHDGLPMKQLLESKIPKLIHFSITGLGGTEYEPGVMKPMDLLDKIGEYIQQGLDPDIITIRIDPIVPGVTTPRMIEEIIKKASSLGIKRIRFSIMDAYAHTVMEMSKLGYDFNANYGINPVTNQPYYNAKTEKINAIAEFMLKMKDKYNVTLGTCAEGLVREGISKEGCLSVASVNKMLGTSIPDLGTENNEQRKLCSCYGGKIDALQYNNTCASHCIYCYAKHANDQAMHYYNEDGTLKDNNFTRTRQSQSIPNPKEYINHSGGAYGADTAWDLIGRQYGVSDNRHYRESNNPNVSNTLKKAGVDPVILSKEQLEEARDRVEKLLGKRYEDTIQGNLKVRNFYQVINSDGIFAIAKLNKDKTGVLGGTNTAIQLGKQLNKEIYVWDVDTEKWYSYDTTSKIFVETDTPILTKNFAGIGTRDIQNYNIYDKDTKTWKQRPEYVGDDKKNKALQAIRDVFKKTFTKESVINEQNTQSTSTPSSIKDNNFTRTRQPKDLIDKQSSLDTVEIEKTGRLSTESWNKVEQAAKQMNASHPEKSMDISKDDTTIHIEQNDQKVQAYGSNVRKGVINVGAFTEVKENSNPIHDGIIVASTIKENNDGSISAQGSLKTGARNVFITPINITIKGKEVTEYLQAVKAREAASQEFDNLMGKGAKGKDDYLRGANAKVSQKLSALNRKVTELINSQSSQSSSTPSSIKDDFKKKGEELMKQCGLK